MLDKVLARIPRWPNENVLVGFDTSDDAGVYKLTPECALVQTVDFFTPIVDDPATYGAIAAANSLSDVYAMGGVPITALSVLAWPAQGDLDVLAAILQGGAETMQGAGCAVLGGHSVNDPEVKFGYAVTGTVHPERVWTNAGARVGDALVLTKPLGTGVLATAAKRSVDGDGWMEEAIRSMRTLNRAAADVLRGLTVHGCTDVTGFGLLGHGREMACASGVTLKIDGHQVPALPGAREAIGAGAVPGGLRNNLAFVEGDTAFDDGVDEVTRLLLCDPQTSGGLLVALLEENAARFLDSYEAAWRIGRVVAREERLLRVV